VAAALTPGVLGRRAWLLAALASSTAAALGRTPYGGVLRMKLPWPTARLDPHATDDAAAAIFGQAIFDPLYAVDPSGRPYPALAAALPERVSSGLRIVIRPNLMSARGRAMDARDVLFSLSRASRRAAVGLLTPLGTATGDPSDPLAIRVHGRDANAAAVALASPATAIVPRGFNPGAPDGTGAFRAEAGARRLVLRRNLHAARGAAFLERIDVELAGDLSDALRAFEASETDVSWLGEFLHRPRPGAVKFEAGTFGWAVLHTGSDAGGWGAPGVAQKLLDGVPSGQLAHLGLHDLGGSAGSASWGGEPAEILVADDSPHLVAIAKQLAAVLGRPGHELRAAPRPRAELDYRMRARRFALLLGFARRVAPGPRGALISLLAAENPELAKHPPASAPASARSVGHTSSLGVVGELGISGAHVPGVRGLSSWDLGNVWRR
jgi:peptide/nickel transport system substrate-binding protein